MKATGLPTAAEFMKEPEYGEFWKSMAVQPRLTKVEVPTLIVGRLVGPGGYVGLAGGVCGAEAA